MAGGPDPELPCGYCCENPPCGDHSDDHDDAGCEACAAVPMSPTIHGECERMVQAYMEELARDGSAR